MKALSVAFVVSVLAAGGCVESGKELDLGDGAVAQADMPAYCTQKASAALGVEPKQISLFPVDRSGGIYTIQGQHPPRGEGARTFQCQFDPEGKFISVIPTSKRG